MSIARGADLSKIMRQAIGCLQRQVKEGGDRMGENSCDSRTCRFGGDQRSRLPSTAVKSPCLTSLCLTKMRHV